ncbi:MAG TPA: glycosyltransferase [Longimicrobium sp.]|nr:glycosyltransferase [Longimicrobium sp.]
MTFYLALLILAALAAMLVELVRGNRHLGFLAHVPTLDDSDLPMVSAIVAARDEERGMEAALRSLLAQDLARFEVIVVDDRSTDRTGEILDRMAAAEPRLRVLHVAELPAGWLGKNHALHLGAAQARGELLVFTDADIVMTPDTVRRAASHAVRRRLDHLTMAPRVHMPGFLLQAFGVVFGIFFIVFTRPWKASDPRSRSHVGIGAFNLVRADAYQRIGTHRAIAMRPDDDLKLGKLVKKNGLRQDFLVASEHIAVEWYASVREAVRGLRKNGFAGLDYRMELVIGSTLTLLVVFVWPFLAIFVTDGATRTLYAVAVAAILAIYVGAARHQRVPVVGAIAFPVASLLFVVVIWNATLYALRHRGIEWRGTHYPLDELRANRI